jgi:undecaprenyl-diphosphatase
MLAFVVLIAILVPEGPLGIDRSWAEAMHDLEIPLLTHVALAFNWLGRGLGRAVGLALVGLLLLRRRRWLALAAFAVAESLAPLLSVLLKALVDRPRPPHGLIHAASPSFPSGHATYAGATCLALVLLFTTPGSRRRWVVGAREPRSCRHGLESYVPPAHWLTDAVAGALLGSGIALLVFAVAQRQQSRAVAILARDSCCPSETSSRSRER